MQKFELKFAKIYCLISIVTLFFQLTHQKRPMEFDFGCIKIMAEHKRSSSSTNGNSASDFPGAIEQRNMTKKALRGKLVVKRQTHGFITSNGYPRDGYVNQKCAVELEAPTRSGLVLHLSFVDVDLEPRYSRSGQCLRDYLVLTIIDRDGREHTSERICGTEKPEPVRSMQSKARVFFVASSTSQLGNSTNIKRRKGFKLRYEFVAEATILAPSSYYYDPDKKYRAECGGVNSPTALSGEIRSPGFPFTYPRNITCYWLLRVASHRRLYIRILDLELSPTVAECDRASLHLLDGYRHDMLTKQQQMADESWASAIVTSTGSKRRAAKGDASAADVDFCGSSQYFAEEGMKSYLSDGNRVVVKFTTRDGPTQEQLHNFQKRRKPIGFRLLWTEVESLLATSSDVPAPLADEPDPEHPSIITADQCPGFVCLGGTFCVDSLDSVCVERTRLCINETLRCDGVSNCAENDDSDEEYCYSQNPVSLSAFALLLIALIVILLGSTFCVLRHLGQRSKRRRMAARLEMEEQRRRKKNAETSFAGFSGDSSRRRRRLSDTRMRKLQIPTVSSMVEEMEEVRTNIIPATPPVMGQENGSCYGWRELKEGGILIHDLDMMEVEETVDSPPKLPCLCPIQQNGGNAPKVRVLTREEHLDEIDNIWERRRSAILLESVMKSTGILMESIS